MTRSLFLVAHLWLCPFWGNAFGQTKADLLTEALAQEMVDAIFYQVWGMVGTPPTVVFQKNMDEAVAVYFGGANNQVRVAQKTIDLLERRYGSQAPDALAVVIGHEMHHARTGNTGLKYGFTGKKSEHFQAERDADYFGLCYAYAAGYDGCIEIYDSVFETLNIRDGEGYPATSERKKMNEQVVEDALRLVGQFEAANWLLLLGGHKQCEFAYALYEKVEKELAGMKEIHFSKGLAALSLALEYANAREIYPVEVQEPEFLHFQRSLDGKPVDEELAADFFKKAKESFLRASSLDAGFLDARLGHACALVSEKNWPAAADALASIRDCEGLSTTFLERVRLVQAILDFKQGRKEGLSSLKNSKYPLIASLASLNLGEKSQQGGGPCASFNLPTLDGVANTIRENDWLLEKMGDGKVYVQGLLKSGITCYQNGSYRYVFQESKHFKPPLENAFPVDQWHQGIGRWRLWRCNEEEALVRLDSHGRVSRGVKVVRSAFSK